MGGKKSNPNQPLEISTWQFCGKPSKDVGNQVGQEAWIMAGEPGKNTPLTATYLFTPPAIRVFLASLKGNHWGPRLMSYKNWRQQIKPTTSLSCTNQSYQSCPNRMNWITLDDSFLESGFIMVVVHKSSKVTKIKQSLGRPQNLSGYFSGLFWPPIQNCGFLALHKQCQLHRCEVAKKPKFDSKKLKCRDFPPHSLTTGVWFPPRPHAYIYMHMMHMVGCVSTSNGPFQQNSSFQS